MRRRDKLERADIPEGQQDPLSYALHQRDHSVIDMVEAAVRHKEVLLAYQPVMTARNPKEPAFYEGLIRVLDATGRVIPARDFITTVENTETGRMLDCLALEIGLKALSQTHDLRLSLNMSARSIGYGRWMRTLKRWLSKDPTLARRLILEVTESSTMLVPELVTGFMSKLHQQGVSFALDNFGAGATSLKYLRDFSFDILKIDGQFTRGISLNPDNQVLTVALASIAEQFDMISVAENVENAADARFLRDMGIDCLQGYFFGAPTVRPPWAAGIKARAGA
jgi:EAL domain-containing protein (putative c-di-GMP-specific phosphodiesterase class I)